METESSFAGQTVAVFGAARKNPNTPTWGSKFADRIEPLAGRMLRVDPRLAAGCDPGEAIRAADVVLFAVTPDDQINGIVSTHFPQMRRQQNFLECSTTKAKIAETLYRLDRGGMGVCSLHPGARADLSSRGQRMMIMSVGENGERVLPHAREITTLLQMTPVEFVSFESHRKAMALTQALDHAVQRAKIAVLAQLLPLFGFTHEQAQAMGFANSRVGELGTGRVAAQDPRVSGIIVAEALGDDETRQVVDLLAQSLAAMAHMDAASLTEQFEKDIKALDPDGAWRKSMLSRTSRVLEQMANLGIKGLLIYSPRNEPGVLEEITHVLRLNGINITAITSHNLEPEEGRPGVIFLLGIDEKCVFDPQKLAADLAKIGVSIEGMGNP